MSNSTIGTDTINRITWGLGAFAAFAGAIAIAGAPTIMPRIFPTMGTTLFQFDPEFLSQGALVVLALWSLSALHFAIVFADGHWRHMTRQLDLVLTTIWAAALFYLIMGPRVYVSAQTDSTAKSAVALLLFFLVISVIQKIRQGTRGS